MTEYNLKDVFDTVWEHRKRLIQFCVAIGVITAIVTLLLPNEYKSTTTFYAASDDLSRPEVMFGISRERSYYFGGDNERDKIKVVGKSLELFNRLQQKFDFYSHYGVDSTKPKAQQKVHKKFKKDFEIIQNDLDAMELSFIADDPQFAADVANEARKTLEILVTGFIKSSQKDFMNSLESKIEVTQKLMDQVNDSIIGIRQQYKIYNSENQINQLAEIITAKKNKLESEQARFQMYSEMRGVPRDTLNNIQANIAGLKNQIKAIENPDSLSSKGLNILELSKVKPLLQQLEGQYFTLKGELARDEIQYGILEVVQETETRAIHVIEAASVPIDKFRPKRSLIVIVSMMVAFIFYVLGLLLITGLRGLNAHS